METSKIHIRHYLLFLFSRWIHNVPEKHSRKNGVNTLISKVKNLWFPSFKIYMNIFTKISQVQILMVWSWKQIHSAPRCKPAFSTLLTTSLIPAPCLTTHHDAEGCSSTLPSQEFNGELNLQAQLIPNAHSTTSEQRLNKEITYQRFKK